MAVDTNTDGRVQASVAYVDRRLLGMGAALLTAGLMASLAGAAMGAVAVVGAGRRYVADRNERPGEMARRRWEQARSATVAGVGAWQEHGRQARPQAVR